MFHHLNSFRVRLLLVLAALLVATLGVQYLINYYFAKRVATTIGEQEQALAIGMSLALEGVSSSQYLNDIRARQQPEMPPELADRLINILIVNGDGLIKDSLDPRFQPETLNDGSVREFRLSEVALPPLVDAGRATQEIAALLGEDFDRTPPQVGVPRAFPVRTETNKGTTYIIVVLGSPNTPDAAVFESAAALLPALFVLLLATFAAAFLVWRFTRPIADLSEGARRVAAGDFSFRVPAESRRDEMGALATSFNRMIEQVGHTRELEMQVQQAERSAVVGRLASAIAHEIRNPLNYINLTLDHLRNSLAPEDATKRETFNRLAGNLKTEVARINARISEFLNYTRPSRLNREPLDLRQALTDALHLVEAQAAESNITTHLNAPDDTPPVLADADALRSVFTNLMLNAVQVMESAKHGALIVTLTHDTTHAHVRITDTGEGIAPENISQIFEPYFSTKETGTGLGLAIVKKAIDDHGGTINVESIPDEGTTFVVSLPLAVGSGQWSVVS